MQSTVLSTLGRWPRGTGFRLAFSGGLDSSVLLDILAGARADLPCGLGAVHVNHGIHPDRDKWERHCRDRCRSLRVELSVLHVDATPPPGRSPEAWARSRRYRALRDRIHAGEILLTAHSQDDQVETVLLQLCRGSGPDGLAAMPELRRFGAGWHGRPLLHFDRAALRAYAQQRGLAWIEDDSNLDRRFDRNFVRWEIVPRLRGRWPGVARAIARAARHQAHAAELLESVGSAELQSCMGADGERLDLRRFRDLPRSHQANVLRLWARSRGLRVPDDNSVHRILDEAVQVRDDAMPLIRWPGAELRRYRHHLYLSPPLPPHDPGGARDWQLDAPCELDCGTLRAVRTQGGGLRAAACPGPRVEVRFRRGGERLRPAGSPHHRELKTLLQERGVPPWLRDRLPLLYVGARLAAVADLWIDADFAAGDAEEAWQIHWQPLIS